MGAFRDMALVFVFLLFLTAVEGYKKLGSAKPATCTPQQFDCPSHMLCVASRSSNAGHKCRCHRFFGFTGPQCRGGSRATWLLFAFLITLSIFAVWALLSNIMLALELKEAGRLKPNCIGRTLFFNTLVSISLLAHYMGMTAIILDLDPGMNYAQHGAVVCLPFISFSFVLATLSVSVVWIIDVQKASAMRTGITSSAKAKKQERVYLAGLYMFSLSAATLLLIIFFRSENQVLLSLFFSALYCTCVGFSYLYAGQRVLAHLHVPNVSCAPNPKHTHEIRPPPSPPYHYSDHLNVTPLCAHHLLLCDYTPFRSTFLLVKLISQA
jgi:hypothetical protein